MKNTAQLITLRTFLLSISFIFIFCFSATAPATPAFQDYAVSTQTAPCAKLDFTSYHRAQDGQKNIIRENPDLTKPNFGGKYLVLKNELLFETLWLIADCQTGKFYKELLSGRAEFKPDSLLLILSSESKSEKRDPPVYKVWKEDEWIEIDASVNASVNLSCVWF